jgi:hypothetical protein
MTRDDCGALDREASVPGLRIISSPHAGLTGTSTT